ncbi:uncharacterized protein M6B38_111160 [Iris pallida]|uniref:Uncharacterized protein n=1 Tax=Iris pallida TaxID=29817 RepID=A0AAX6DN06_IRIPA|nr:uncharacterized protein M6B38_111160 [Iris pallida]
MAPLEAPGSEEAPRRGPVRRRLLGPFPRQVCRLQRPEPVSATPSRLVDDEAFLDVGKSPAISRRERMAAAGKEERFSYSSRASFRGEGGSISIDVERKEMRISVEGKRIVEVRRLQWKFRGSDRVELGGGDAVLVSWDLHDWLFPPRRALTLPLRKSNRCLCSDSRTKRKRRGIFGSN